MLATIYLHPERTVAALWRMDEVPVLIDLVLADAVDLEGPAGLPSEVSALLDRCEIIRIAVPTSATVLHRYPVEMDESIDDRRSFEVATCLPGVDHDTDLVLDLALPWPVNDASWHVLAVVPHEIRRQLLALFEGRRVDRCCLSIATEGAAAAMARHVTGTTVVVGRREDRWESLGVEMDGSIGHIFLRSDDTRIDASVIVRDIILDIRATTGKSVDRCLIYGDGLTKAELDDIAIAVTDLVGSTQRCNPFRAVMAEASDDVKSTCLRLAHLLGPVVGLLSPAEPALSIPDLCASLVDS